MASCSESGITPGTSFAVTLPENGLTPIVPGMAWPGVLRCCLGLSKRCRRSAKQDSGYQEGARSLVIESQGDHHFVVCFDDSQSVSTSALGGSDEFHVFFARQNSADDYRNRCHVLKRVVLSRGVHRPLLRI